MHSCQRYNYLQTGQSSLDDVKRTHICHATFCEHERMYRPKEHCCVAKKERRQKRWDKIAFLSCCFPYTTTECEACRGLMDSAKRGEITFLCDFHQKNADTFSDQSPFCILLRYEDKHKRGLFKQAFFVNSPYSVVEDDPQFKSPTFEYIPSPLQKHDEHLFTGFKKSIGRAPRKEIGSLRTKFESSQNAVGRFLHFILTYDFMGYCFLSSGRALEFWAIIKALVEHRVFPTYISGR